MDREPFLGDLVEIRPNTPVLGLVIKTKESDKGIRLLEILWPSGDVSTHEASKFQTVVSSSRMEYYLDWMNAASQKKQGV